MGRRPIVDYDEETVYTGWRRAYCWTQRPGTCKGVKTKTHRRERREARREITEERQQCNTASNETD